MKPRMWWPLILALVFVTGLMALLGPRAQAAGWWRCVNPGGTGNPNTSSDGGGIWIAGSPTISNTWVNNNTGYWGGGLTVWGGSPTLVNVPAWSNKALLGGGIYIQSATVTIAGLRIWWNRAPQGGGIYTSLTPSLQIENNTINWNTAHSAGGGVYLGRSVGLLSNNGLFGNVVTGTGALGGGAFVTGNSSGVTLERNWFESNSAVSAGADWIHAWLFSGRLAGHPTLSHQATSHRGLPRGV